jgi:hypothetical protein
VFSAERSRAGGKISFAWRGKWSAIFRGRCSLYIKLVPRGVYFIWDFFPKGRNQTPVRPQW